MCVCVSMCMFGIIVVIRNDFISCFEGDRKIELKVGGEGETL